MNEKRTLDESLRRLGAIIAAPSLLLHYGHTTPALEGAYLRKIGLDKQEKDAFLDLMCRRGLLDEGARSVLEAEAFRRGLRPAELARQMLREDREEKEHGLSPRDL